MKQSKIRRLISKKLARQIADARGAARAALETKASQDAADAIAKMRSKGYALVTRLESGEGVFVRENDVVGLHVQLSSSLYHRLNAECEQRAMSKRRLVSEALEAYLDAG